MVISSRLYGVVAGLTLTASGLLLTTSELSASWSGTGTPLAVYEAPDWVPINGNVRLADGTPVCAMVLANGQYMFSCGGNGAYSLNIPLDDQGLVTLFAFADGFAPFRVTAAPAGLPAVVRPQPADPGSPLITVTRDMECAGNGWVRVRGEIESFGGDPLCALVLANGQHMFTCGASQGQYDLTVPMDENGNITVFGFADGFQPYRETSVAPPCRDGRFPSCIDISGNWFAQESITFTCSFLGETDTETQSGSGSTFITQDGCNISYPSIPPDVTRHGVVEGNQVTVTGPFAIPVDSGFTVTFSHNAATASGTATSSQINLNGSGSVSGTANGSPFSCTGTSTATFTR